MRPHLLEHRFVDTIPDRLDEGVLYVSLEYATVNHLCCCGCGSEVVTPLSPTDWELIFDGVSVSLHPSIGNWSLKCRSHYVIDCGRVNWAGQWSDAQIAAERAQDRRAKFAYYGGGSPVETKAMETRSSAAPERGGFRGIFAHPTKWWRGR